MIKTIQHNWLHEVKQELVKSKHIRIVSPFITDNLVRLCLQFYSGDELQVITRFNLNDFRSGVSSISALERLLNAGADIKGIQGLHSKLYLFDQKSVIITSANFTNGGFFQNKEFGIKSYEEETILSSINYFNELWNIDDNLLTTEQLDEWKPIVKRAGNNQSSIPALPDYGKSYQKKVIGQTDDHKRKYFIKFFGKNESRGNLSDPTRWEIEYSCSHYALSFSDKKGWPRRYRDGDVVYMARLIHGNDSAIFGKGITYKHIDKRDIVGPDDISHIDWLEEWPVLIRLHSTEFIDSTLENCPKMNEMIQELDYESFRSTNDRFNWGERDINPWNSLRQQADIEITELAAFWLEERLQNAVSEFGEIPETFINQFYRGIIIDQP